MLQEVSQIQIKDKDRQYFNPIPYANIIINDQYIIRESKIFYLNGDDHPLQAGILDMEELAETSNESEDTMKELRFAQGPYIILGSDQFICVYNEIDSKAKDTLVYKQRV